MSKIITTSWDDGHPKDFLISELLDKYNLKGTFYIPKFNPENEVMTAEQLVVLSKNNEIGGHTMNHVRLTELNEAALAAEVAGCYSWLKDLLHKDPVSFCFPLGAYNQRVIESVKAAGFKIARTTVLLSVSTNVAPYLIPTTLQLYEHSRFTYFKHLMKRGRLSAFFVWMKTASSSEILKLTDFYVEQILKHDGCFHLWGHSWEIERFQLWNKLELVFRHISNLQEFKYAWNKELDNLRA